MSKTQIIYVCSNCGHRAGTWQGKCQECGQWNTLQEQKVAGGSKRIVGAVAAPTFLSNVEDGKVESFKTGIGEFDDVLGGGIIPGSLVLLGGDPGIGKSTLA